MLLCVHNDEHYVVDGHERRTFTSEYQRLLKELPEFIRQVARDLGRAK